MGFVRGIYGFCSGFLRVRFFGFFYTGQKWCYTGQIWGFTGRPFQPSFFRLGANKTKLDHVATFKIYMGYPALIPIEASRTNLASRDPSEIHEILSPRHCLWEKPTVLCRKRQSSTGPQILDHLAHFCFLPNI